jgi:diguanylate cyclase (GGDEF)-like protein
MELPDAPDKVSSPLLPSGQDISLPWHLRLPRQLEQEFARHFRETSYRLVTGSFFVVLLLLFTGTFLEALMLENAVQDTWRARLLVVMAFAGVFLSAYLRRYQTLMQPAICFSCLLLALTHNYVGLVVEHELSYFYFYVDALAILLMGSMFRVMLYWALPTSALILLCEALTLTFFNDRGNNEISLIMYFNSSVALMSLFGQYFYERLQRRHFLSERVLSLHRSELHTANIALESQATEDGLTGTINRRGLESRLTNLFHARQRGSQRATQRVSLLLFDIDFFKQYNDTYGHQAGDDCLVAVADVPKQMIQNERDFVARYGGEEFMVVLVGTTLQDAMVMAERMRARVEQLGIGHTSSRTSDVVTISVGVATGDPADLTPAELIKRADEALYQAKEAGRNRVVCLDGKSGKVRVL